MGFAFAFFYKFTYVYKAEQPLEKQKKKIKKTNSQNVKRKMIYEMTLSSLAR